MRKFCSNPTGFLDSSSADGGGAILEMLVQKLNNSPILNT